MPGALDDLPRLSNEALGECAFCRRVMLATESPIFYRFTVKQCGVDRDAVNEHVGLGMMLGGGPGGFALAGVMGAQKPPVVVLNAGEISVCGRCQQDKLDIMYLAGRAIES